MTFDNTIVLELKYGGGPTSTLQVRTLHSNNNDNNDNNIILLLPTLKLMRICYKLGVNFKKWTRVLFKF